MNNVLFARVLYAFSILAGASGLALAQDAPADPLAALPNQTEDTSSSTPAADPASDTPQVDAVTSSEIGDAGQIQQARAEMAEQFGVTELSSGEFHWARDIPARGATKVVISLTEQLAFVYRDEKLIGVSTISSGRTDHETPTGTFPVLAKEKIHHS